MKKKLTVFTLKGLKPAETGRREMLWDTVVESFGIRVTDAGTATFVVMRRIDGKLTRHSVGNFKLSANHDDKTLGALLHEAREKARAAVLEMRRGVDPRELEAIEKRARTLRRSNTFAAVAEDFISEHVRTLRSATEVEAIIRRAIARWGDRPVTDITRSDVAEAVRDIAKGAPYAARKFFAYVSSLFNWALGQEDRASYGLTATPCAAMKPDRLGAKTGIRERTLSDGEMRLFWRACEVRSYPFGELMKFLLLTGQRRDEAANVTRAEVDLTKRLWTIPGSRMKSGRPHLVPLSAEAVKLLQGLPCFGRSSQGSDFLFTTTGGNKPVSGFSKAKILVDAAMLDVARKAAAEAGDDPKMVEIPGWRIHDLRRTARTHFSAIPSQDLVRELTIGHARPGLHAVYDQFAYVDERRALLDSWARRLMGIVDPPKGNNVHALRA